MESNSWNRLPAASRRHQPASLQSRYDAYLGFEEVDGGGEEEDSRPEFACPFCCEDFDVVGLCFHIGDEHPVEAKNGVCPVCAAGFGIDMVAHITTEHASIFKIQHRRRFHKSSSGSHSAHTLLTKDLGVGNLHTILGGSFAPSNTAPDPLLSSFISNVSEALEDVRPEPLDEGNMTEKITDEKLVVSPEPSLFDKDLEESAQRSDFLRHLVLSTIFDDAL